AGPHPPTRYCRVGPSLSNPPDTAGRLERGTASAWVWSTQFWRQFPSPSPQLGFGEGGARGGCRPREGEVPGLPPPGNATPWTGEALAVPPRPDPSCLDIRVRTQPCTRVAPVNHEPSPGP